MQCALVRWPCSSEPLPPSGVFVFNTERAIGEMGNVGGTPAEGRVLAKTGTLGGVSALSGYLLHEDPALGEVTFSILGNNGLGAGGLLRPVQDAIVVAVANARGAATDHHTRGGRRE